jgi:hypothetical protein
VVVQAPAWTTAGVQVEPHFEIGVCQMAEWFRKKLHPTDCTSPFLATCLPQAMFISSCISAALIITSAVLSKGDSTACVRVPRGKWASRVRCLLLDHALIALS